MRLLIYLIRGLFVVLLLASAAGKLLDMSGFFLVVARYDVLPVNAIPGLSWLLTLTELGLGIWLALAPAPVQLAWAATAVVSLHLVYMTWLGLAFTRGLNIQNCGCFGVFFPRPLTMQTLLEDSVLLALAVVLVWGARSRLHQQYSPR